MAFLPFYMFKYTILVSLSHTAGQGRVSGTENVGETNGALDGDLNVFVVIVRVVLCEARHLGEPEPEPQEEHGSKGAKNGTNDIGAGLTIADIKAHVNHASARDPAENIKGCTRGTKEEQSGNELRTTAEEGRPNSVVAVKVFDAERIKGRRNHNEAAKGVHDARLPAGNLEDGRQPSRNTKAGHQKGKILLEGVGADKGHSGHEETAKSGRNLDKPHGDHGEHVVAVMLGLKVFGLLGFVRSRLARNRTKHPAR